MISSKRILRRMAHMTEEEYLAQYDAAAFERPSVAVDVVLFTILEDRLQVLLTRRDAHPFRDCPALPGVFVGVEESLEEAAMRALREKAGLQGIYLEQLYTWGDVARDPRMRILSVSYYALVPAASLAVSGEGTWLCPVDEIEKDAGLAFDHARIIAYGRERIRNKVNWSDIAFSLLPEEFTLPQLQRVYEILLDQPLYKANFRKKIADKIVETEKMITGNAHRPSRIYRKRSGTETDQ
ncbi:MAG: NUDIX hydrolase [Oscillospiraceae bacterium]|nr:NUDIX hydrolase [Oscillospiraceae bacterium]